MLRVLLTGLALFCGFSDFAVAQEVGITPEMAEVQVMVANKPLTIARIQDTAAVLDAEFARTSRACPPNCVQPMQAAPGVATYGELEVISFLQTGEGFLIDARLPEGFAAGSLPGAVNVPYATLAVENPVHVDLLRALGAVGDTAETLDFTAAKPLTIYCEGNWSDAAIAAINHLLSAGYPAEKINYYRGGMQDWVHLGLSVAVAGNPG